MRAGNNTWKRELFDGLLKTTHVYQAHENKIYCDWRQPSRRLVLDHVKRLQSNPSALKPEPELLGQLIIPVEDYKRIMRENPELQCNDAETRAKAWAAFLANNPQYRVR